MPVDRPTTNSTFSVSTVTTPECTQQLDGSWRSCSRCPIIDPDTEYDVLLVAEAAGAVMASPAHVLVSNACV